MTSPTDLDDWARSTWPLMTQVASHRRAARITQDQVAEALGVRRRAVGRWDALQCSPKWGWFLAYTAFVGRRVALWDGAHVLAVGTAIPSTLPSIRVAAGLSQRALASLMHVEKTAVVMRETRGCSRLSSIEEYLAPLGARLILLPGDREAVAS